MYETYYRQGQKRIQTSLRLCANSDDRQNHRLLQGLGSHIFKITMYVSLKIMLNKHSQKSLANTSLRFKWRGKKRSRVNTILFGLLLFLNIKPPTNHSLKLMWSTKSLTVLLSNQPSLPCSIEYLTNHCLKFRLRSSKKTKVSRSKPQASGSKLRCYVLRADILVDAFSSRDCVAHNLLLLS